MPRALFVSKDVGGFRVLEDAAVRLQEAGVGISVVAEGLSLSLWERAGYAPVGGIPSPGSFDPKTLLRSDIDLSNVLQTLQPDVVVASMGMPNGVEGSIIREVLRNGGKAVVVSDIHGSGLRANLSPDNSNLDRVLFTALDSVDAGLITGHFNGAKSPRVVETGSPAFDKFNTNVDRARLVVRMTSPFPRTFQILGQNDCTGDFLDGALTVADGFPESVAVVGLHPKYLAVPELCNAWLRRVRDSKSMVLWANGAATTHQYMVSSNYVVSGYSTGLIEAALIANGLGPIAVSWTSELVRNRMSEELGGLTEFPTVTYGAAIEVSSPVEFREKVPAPGTKAFRDFREQAREALRTRLRVDGHATERIVAAIREHAGI